MDNNFSLSDIVAAMGGNGGMGGNAFLFVLLIVLFFGGAWNRGAGDYGQYASASSQQDILFSSKFQALDNKIDRIGNGIADATYALNNAVTGEGRNIQTQMANGQAAILAAIGADGEKTRDLIRDNEMARVRDERDYYRTMWGQRQEGDRILSTQGRYYNNPPCRDQCGCCGN